MFFTVLDSTCVGLRVILCVLPSISLFISVFIKYHHFWAKLRYINIFRKNYLKHVVKNNYIIKPFFPHNILDNSNSEQGRVGACGSDCPTARLNCAILCHFFFSTDSNDPSSLWGRVWHKMAPPPPGGSKKRWRTLVFAPGERSDALWRRSGTHVEKTSRRQARNKDGKQSFSLGGVGGRCCGVSPEGGEMNRRRVSVTLQTLFGSDLFKFFCLTSLLRFLAEAGSIITPNLHLTADNFLFLILHFHARLGLNVNSSLLRRFFMHPLELKQQQARVWCRAAAALRGSTNSQK